MSTTVTYKGSTLTTVDNQTRTLKTAGKYMEGDVVLTDVSGGTSWQTLYDGSAQVYSSSPNYFQISPYTTAFQSDQTYRVTWGQTQYLCNTIADPLGATYDGWLIGNLSIVGAGADTGEPFIIYRNSATELTGGTTSSAGTASLKIELQQGGANLQNKTVTPTTSQQTVQADSGYDGLDTVTVNAMPTGTAGTPTATKGTVSNHSVSVTPSVTNSAGYISGGTINGTAVTVTASELASGNKAITQNGTDIDVVGYSTVSVNVPSSSLTIQSLSITPTTSQQTFNASDVDGYKPVTVAAMPTMTLPTTAASSATSGYTSKATIGRSTAAQYINIPPGYNSAGAYYVISAVANGSTTGPTSLSGSSATITTGTNTITLTKTGVTTTPTVSAGYVSSATASTATVALTASVTVNPTPTASGATVTIPAGYYSTQTTKSVTSGSATAPSSISGTAASVSTGTNTLTLTKTVSVTPTVSAGYVSSGTAGNSSVSLTASVTTKAAATITPTTTNQTIASGTYLTGTQTIAGDADLVGSNILSTANIFGVQGTVDFIDVYIRSTAPTSSVGSDGDIYIQE